MTSNANVLAELDLLDLEPLSSDEQLAATVLAGLINRDPSRGPMVYLLGNQEEGRETWLGELRLEHLNRVPHSNLESVVHRYRSDVGGLVVYDPALPDSINVAVTLCGLEGCIPASPELAERLASRVPLPIHTDLRGRFSSRLDAYAWQFIELWPRCSHRLLVGIPPAKGNPPTPYGGLLHDFAAAEQALVFWLDPELPGERSLLEAIFSAVPPCTPYLGWFPQDVAGEFSGTELASAHGVYVVAADYCANLSLLSASRRAEGPDLGVSTGDPSPPGGDDSSAVTASPLSLEKKIYVTFTFSEGDNLQYMQHRMRRLWDDPARGQVPLNWSVSPCALDFAPALLDFYLGSRTAEDCLIAGPSGAGYCYPNAWPVTELRTFTRQTANAMRRLGLELVWVLNRTAGKSVTLTSEVARAYQEDISPLGMLLNYEPQAETVVLEEGLPQAVTAGVSSRDEALRVLAFAALLWDESAPLFISLGVLAWSMTPSDVAAVVGRLGESPYQVVRGDDFFRLVRQAYGLLM
jgi:hypothetical protein